MVFVIVLGVLWTFGWFAIGAYFVPKTRKWIAGEIEAWRPPPVVIYETQVKEIVVTQFVLPEDLENQREAQREAAVRRIRLLGLDPDEEEEFTQYVLPKIDRKRLT